MWLDDGRGLHRSSVGGQESNIKVWGEWTRLTHWTAILTPANVNPLHHAKTPKQPELPSLDCQGIKDAVQQ